MPKYNITTLEDLDDIRVVEASNEEEALKLYLEGEGEPWSKEDIASIDLTGMRQKKEEKKSLRERAKDKLKW